MRKELTPLRSNINEIKKISSVMPKTIKEAMDYNDFDGADEYEVQEREPEMGEMEPERNCEGGQCNVEASEFVNNIRKMSLQMMATLADDPTNATYDIAKRIWQICDKAYNNDNKETQQNAKMDTNKMKSF